jgi:chromosomal replication initiation ATPase DnaA
MLDSLWASVLESLSPHQQPPAGFDSWLRHCDLRAVQGDDLRIGAPNLASGDWLTQQHLQALQSAAEQCVGGHPPVSIVVDDAAATAPDQRATLPVPAGSTGAIGSPA